MQRRRVGGFVTPLVMIIGLSLAGCSSAPDRVASETVTPVSEETAQSTPASEEGNTALTEPTLVPTVIPTATAQVEQDESESASRGNRSTPLFADIIEAEARVVPVANVEISFESSGIVSQVLVEEGAPVERGQVIARLNSGDFLTRIDDAEASLAQAQARLREVESNVSPQDVAAAQAEVEEAQTVLAELLAGPKDTEIRNVEADVERAQASLQTTRDQLSSEKNDAELALEQAANDVRDAQDAYSRIYWENQEKLQRDDELDPEDRDLEAAALRDIENAQAVLEQAELNFELAQQAEVTGIQEAEAAVKDAQAALEQLLRGADPDEIAAARSQVANAEAALTELTGSEREAAINTARVAVQERQTSLRGAQSALEKAVLRAPITGTVAEMNVAPGEEALSGRTAFVIADFSAWRIETSDLVELDVVDISDGADAIITFDAIPDLELPGRVVRVKPVGTNLADNDYATYTVVIEPLEWDQRLRWNMTAFVEIAIN